MKKLTALALGVCIATASAGASFAQMSNTMSSSDKAQMTKCQGMSASAMQGDSQCAALMKKYPDAMKNGTTGSGAANPGMSPGASSGTGMNKTK